MLRRGKAGKARTGVAERLPNPEAVRERVTGAGDDLADALESVRDAIGRTLEARRKDLEDARHKGTSAGRRGAKTARGKAREAAERLPEPEQMAELTRRVTERFFPERAKARRKAQRRSRRRLAYGGAAVAGLGLLVGWLTAPKRGQEARQAMRDRASKAREQAAEARERAAAGQPDQQADVHPIHQSDGHSQAER